MASAPDNPLALTRQLRSRAEARLLHEPPDLEGLSSGQIQEALHELHVHQIELEMQNEQLRQTQAELEKARERYLNLYDFAPVGYLTINEEGLIQEANLTSVNMLGVERSRLSTLSFSFFVFKEDQDRYYLALRKAFDSQKTQACEVRLRPKGREPFYARLELVQGTENGKDVCHLALSNITDQKRAEESVRDNQRRQFQYENEERMRLAFDAGELGACDEDLLTKQIICSEGACALLGFPSGKPVAWSTFLERIHPEDRPGFADGAENSARPGGPSRFEATFRVALPGGNVRWIRFASRTYFDNHLPVRRAAILADITRERADQELLESRAVHLEALVRERTARLQEAVNELEHFSYTLAHDLRAPLRAISGYGSLLLAEGANLSPAHAKFIARTEAAVLRMDRLITDALDYNKLVRQNFTLGPVDCGALLRQIVDSYPQFQDASDHISIIGPFPPVLGNQALLTQCFSNLLNNALKFVPAGRTPEIHIYGQETERRLRIWVEDNGIGIPQDCQSKIFVMFQRLNPKYEGTGIGLALVRKAAERMHGAVGVESQPGEGSRFWVELNKA